MTHELNREAVLFLVDSLELTLSIARTAEPDLATAFDDIEEGLEEYKIPLRAAGLLPEPVEEPEDPPVLHVEPEDKDEEPE